MSNNFSLLFPSLLCPFVFLGEDMIVRGEDMLGQGLYPVYKSSRVSLGCRPYVYHFGGWGKRLFYLFVFYFLEPRLGNKLEDNM